MRSSMVFLLLAACLLVSCVWNPGGATLAELHDVEPDLTEVQIDNGLEQALVGYQEFLEEAPESKLTPEAMRRLADLKLEREFGIIGHSKSEPLPAPETAKAANGQEALAPASLADASIAAESRQEFEDRATGSEGFEYTSSADDLELPVDRAKAASGPLEAIALYDEILQTYPDYPNNDQVLYQKARAFDELGRIDEAIEVTQILVSQYPQSSHIDEVQFRRAEYFFTRKKFLDAENAYGAVVAWGPRSDYYELALYKLGWTLYKQMMLEEALEQYITLLDYKVSVGYDFDQTEDEADESRISDTYRVISLCFSDLGGIESVTSFFDTIGERSYEHRVYRQLGEFYLEKLRYADAASVYEAFVDRYPYHEVSPHFSMRVVEIYETGGFPKLVLEAKKAFAAQYGLQSRYWSHFQVDDSPEVVAYLKTNLKDLANHYHALYQNTDTPESKPEYLAEATRWYRAYLDSFPTDPESPSIHYQLADLHLENGDFGVAAREYEYTAYEYPDHPKASAAGYAAIFAHREHQKVVPEGEVDGVRLEAVESSLRFVDRFPEHENAAVVLGAATDDLYALQEFDRAIANGRRLIREYPDVDARILRDAWTVVAHSSFDILDFEAAEAAYAQVLTMTSADEKTRQGIVDNLAASIYKQGEKADESQDYQAAAAHYLRIAELAPTSTIRPIAEYDAGTALIALQDWAGAARVFESFRKNFPEHDLSSEATRQVAFIYREDGNLSRAAEEYERVAAEADDPESRREALLVAGDLYESAKLTDRALDVYRRYVTAFSHPIEPAVVTRFKIAEIYGARGDEGRQDTELKKIIEVDAAAGDDRTDVIRVTAARSALILSEKVFHSFEEVELRQPFERNLQEKQRRMDIVLSSLERLIDYEVGEVTAAATFYMGETFGEFSRSLMESERPSGLSTGELQDYEMVLEEEAYPFEERAIELHEKNLELMTAGVFNEWIEKSLGKLAVVMPGRYAKFEVSSGVIESLDTYAYRTPRSEASGDLADGGVEVGSSEEQLSDPRRFEASSGESPSVHEVVFEESDIEDGSAGEAPIEKAEVGEAALESGGTEGGGEGIVAVDLREETAEAPPASLDPAFEAAPTPAVSVDEVGGFDRTPESDQDGKILGAEEANAALGPITQDEVDDVGPE